MARILVIDDEAVIHMALTQLLETDGHTVIKAANGNEGLAAFKEAPVDVVITDILMPDKEGLETITELREISPDIQIIAMSGGGQMSKVSFLEYARKLGANKTMKKPFHMNELRDAVNDCLEAAGRGP